MKRSCFFPAKTNVSAAQQIHAHKHTVIHTEIQWDIKSCWPRSWHAALSLLYLDHIFMYFYFLGSPTGDSQNGVSGVNFTEHDFLLDGGCSQPIFHGCSKQESSERGSGDRCSLEDSEIDRKRKTTTDNGPHLSLAELQLSFSPLYGLRGITSNLFDRICFQNQRFLFFF